MIYDVSHRTTFEYSQNVSISHHLLHLTPRDSRHQVCRRSGQIVEPAPTVSHSGRDYFGNPVTNLTIQESHAKLIVHATSTVEVTPAAPPDSAATMPWDQVHREMAGSANPEILNAFQFAFDSPFTRNGDGAADYAFPSFPPGRPVLEAAVELMGRIHGEFKYEGGVTDVSTPIDQVLADRRGVCQDFAHLQIACLRSLGLPARYVSGYVLTRPPEGQAKLVGSDASHAWLAVWCPGQGWIDLDPTNNLIPRDEHVTLAWGRDYGDVSPVNGLVVGGGEHKVSVAVDVVPAGTYGG
ncbi:MAG TPA: transglutaminase family protein [Rhodospirillales bacterium]|jgi:transglutaminase-like putative cysteine protease